jgi:hypothetical protein
LRRNRTVVAPRGGENDQTLTITPPGRPGWNAIVGDFLCERSAHGRLLKLSTDAIKWICGAFQRIGHKQQ